jgi:hypothetical protein
VVAPMAADRRVRQGIKRKQSSVPPWIRKRQRIESEIIERCEILGIEPPPRPGTKAHDDFIRRVIEQGKARWEKELDNSPPIPF